MSPRWPAGLHPQTGSGVPAGFRPRRIPVPDVVHYSRPIRVPLTGAERSVTLDSSGAGTIQVGPQGLGVRWYLTQLAGQTTTGANDTSTVAVYFGAQIQQNLIGATTYAGGQFLIGVNVPALTPGALITAVWSGGHGGDTATLVPYGEMDALT